MEKVTVKVQDLINDIKDNLERHEETFDATVEAYRELAVKKLEEHINRIKRGAVESVQVRLPAPENHSDDYKAAIRMLEMTVQEEIEIDERTFRQLVLDEWTWKAEFLATSQFYMEE